MAVFRGTAAPEPFVGTDGVFDRVLYTGTIGITIDLTDPTGASNTGDAFGDTYTSIEGFSIGGSGADTFIGDADAQVIVTGGGNDTVNGGGGPDRINTGGGNDTILVEAGQGGTFEKLDGGLGFDVVALIGGGEFDFTDTVLLNVEVVDLIGPGTELILEDDSNVDLISANNSDDDVVRLLSVTDTGPDVNDLVNVAFTLIDNGVETVIRDRENIEINITLNEPLDQLEFFIDDTAGDFQPIITSLQRFDRDGDIRFADQLNDDGRLIITNFDEDGVITDRTTTDTFDNFAFEQITEQFDSNGLLDSSFTVLDDGGIIDRDFDAGTLVSSFQLDTNDTRPFQIILQTFYSDGTLQTREQINDAGANLARTFFAYEPDGSLDFREFEFADGDFNILGGDGDNIIGGPQFEATNDTLTGGGGNDTFVAGPGIDRITDFDDEGDDLIDLTFFGFDGVNDFDELTNAGEIEQDGANVSISLDGGSSELILADTLLADMGNDDFTA